MSSRLRQQILAMSQEDETTVEIPVVEEGADSLEADLAEVIAADQEVVEADSAVEELTEVHESLEQIALSLESAIQNGGLDPMGAQMLQHALNNSVVRIGFENTTPSLESFGGESDRERATVVSLEGVREWIVKIWNAIKAALAKFWAATTSMFYKMFAAGPKLIARGRALRAKANSVEGAPGADAKIKLSGIAADLAEAPGEISKINAVIDDVLGEHAGAMAHYGDAVASFLKGISLDSDESFNSGVTKVLEIKFPVPKSTGTAANASDYGVSGTHEAKTSGPLPGGKILVAVTGKAGSFTGVSGAREYLAKGLGGSKVFMTTPKGHKEREGDLEVKPLGKDEIGKMGDTAARIGADIERYSRLWKGAAATKKEITNAGDAYSKKGSDKLTGEAVSIAKALPKLAQEAGTQLDSAQRVVLAYAGSAAQAMLAVGEKSLSTYKKEKPAAKEPAAAAA